MKKIVSYIIYMSTVISASLFAFLAQKLTVKNLQGESKLNPVFWIISMLILIITMGFRGITVGVDDLNYLKGYIAANSMSIFDYYNITTTEPGFYLLYRIVYYVFNDFQYLIIITSTITIVLFYKTISYELKNLSLGLVVFVFASTQYFYYFGIIRMGLACAIVAVAYRYILENKKKKFIYCVLLATMFHFSALFALGLIFISSRKQLKFNKSVIWKLVLIIPLAFLAISFLVYPFLGNTKYQGYVESGGFISLGFVSSLPLLLLFMIHYKQLSESNINFQFYYILFVIKIITEIFSPIIGIGRMVWYVNFSLCFLFVAVIHVNKDKWIKLILAILIIMYCIVYSYYAYFGDSPRGQYMIPYKNILIE